MLLALTLVGCNENENNKMTKAIIPEEIITRVVGSNEKSSSYYGEAKIENYENKKKTYEYVMKEWVSSDNKERTDIISDSENSIVVSDGKTIAIYMKNENELIKSSVLKNNSIPKNSKDMVMNELERINKTHLIENKGEEKLNERKVYHLYGKPKNSNSLFGDVEYWIDKERWFIVKSITNSGNITICMEYTKLDFDVDIDDKIFNIDMPKDVKITNTDEMEENKIITVDELSSKLGIKPLIYKDNDYKLNRIEYIKGNDLTDDEFTEVYTDINDIEAFSISVFKKRSIENDEIFSNEQKLKVRNTEGLCMESNDFKIISWNENGLTYNVFTIAPNINTEQLKEIVEKLKELS